MKLNRAIDIAPLRSPGSSPRVIQFSGNSLCEWAIAHTYSGKASPNPCFFYFQIEKRVVWSVPPAGFGAGPVAQRVCVRIELPWFFTRGPCHQGKRFRYFNSLFFWISGEDPGVWWNQIGANQFALWLFIYIADSRVRKAGHKKRLDNKTLRWGILSGAS